MKKKEDEENFASAVKCENSFYLFSKDNRFRKFLFRLMKHRFFERTILTLIVLSSIKLAMDTYIMDRKPEETIVKVSEYVDVFFTISFTLESIIKSTSLGFV